jgi:translocation and assembly module TamB
LSVTSPNADLRYQGRLGASVVAGTLQAEIRRLEALSGLAGRRLSGSFSGTAKLDGNPKTRSIRAEVDARGTGIAIAQPVIDRLTGGRLTVRGIVRTLPDGYGFENLSIEGASFSGHVDGSATQSAADVTARLELSDLEKVHPALSGRAATTARLSGSLARPDLAASLTTTDARALGRPIRDLKVDATVNDVTGPLDAGLSATGSIGGRPLRASARLRKGTDPAWTLDGLDVLVGSASIKGRATIDPADLVDGTLRIAAPDLDHLSPLVLTPLAGALDATVTLARVNGGQDAQVQAKGSAIRAFGIALDGLDIDLAASDVRRHPVIDGHVLAQSLKAGGETFTSVDLRARGTPQASDLSLVATSRGFALDGRARLYPADRTRLEVSSLSAERGRQRLSLAGPATFTFDSGSVDISGLVVAAGTGRISVSGRAGSELNLKIAARAVPLSIVDVVLPDAGLSGTLDGEAELAGSSSRPNGRYRLSLSGFAAPQTRSAGLPLIEASASGRLADGRADIDGRVRAGAGVDLAVAGAVPLEADGPLRLTIKGRADAALANTLLGATGRSVSGRIQIDAGLSGTPRVPKIDGQATLSGGTFVDALQGIRLSDVQGRFVGSGDRITIERLTATTRNGGPVSVEGTVTVNAAAGFPGSLRIRARRAELVSNDIVDAVASLDLTLEGPLAQRPRIAGRVDLVSMDVTVPDRFSATVQPLPGTRHIAPPPKIKALLAEIRKAEVERKSARPFDASLDIVLSAPNRIFVRGRGIDAELGGDLRLTGTSRDPVAIGAFELRRGRFTIIGQRLDFTRGRLDFTGDLSPELDFVAEANAGEVTARVSVTGPASRPDIALTSEPPLPQDEVLSRLLFQKASGSVSGFQALQLAQAVAQFAGTGSGPGVFEEARRALGVDSLDITSGAKGGPALGVSRYIGDRLSVGVKAGARTEDAGVTVGIDVTRRVKVQGDIGADGRTSLGVGAEWEY